MNLGPQQEIIFTEFKEIKVKMSALKLQILMHFFQKLHKATTAKIKMNALLFSFDHNRLPNVI